MKSWSSNMGALSITLNLYIKLYTLSIYSINIKLDISSAWICPADEVSYLPGKESLFIALFCKRISVLSPCSRTTHMWAVLYLMPSACACDLVTVSPVVCPFSSTIYLLSLKLLNSYSYTFMEHLTTYAFTMFKCYHSTNLSYTCCLIMIFSKYSETPCNSAGIIPTKNMNRILVIIV